VLCKLDIETAYNHVNWKFFTMDNLRNEHVIIVDWCFMCKKSREFVDHLLLHREIASAL
jgi:hypothetical protein